MREAQIVLNQAEAALHALGYSHKAIDQVASLEDTEFSAYQLASPLTGMVIERHLAIGEVIEPSSDESPFVIADLSTVWVNLTVYQRDLALVKTGDHVDIRFGHGIPDAHGKIAFVSPALDEKTRTATARVVLKNPEGHWRPGLFVTGEIESGHEQVSVIVPRAAITELDGTLVVFVRTDEGFGTTTGATGPYDGEGRRDHRWLVRWRSVRCPQRAGIEDRDEPCRAGACRPRPLTRGQLIEVNTQ